MRKEERTANNQEALRKWEECIKEFIRISPNSPARLRVCDALVYYTENFIYLKSYDTFVACIDKRTNTLYDMHRYMSGYTIRHSQHIGKFCYDYGAAKIVRYS